MTGCQRLARVTAKSMFVLSIHRDRFAENTRRTLMRMDL